MKMKSILKIGIFFLLSIVIINCKEQKKESKEEQETKELKSEKHAWNEEQKEAFINNCESFLIAEGIDNPESYAKCLLDLVIENYPIPDEALNISQQEMVTLFESSDCLDDLLLIKIENPWTPEVEDVFLEHCIEAQIKQGKSKEEAERYCDCALGEIKDIIPNPHHVMTLTQEELDRILNNCK